MIHQQVGSTRSICFFVFEVGPTTQLPIFTLCPFNCLAGWLDARLCISITIIYLHVFPPVFILSRVKCEQIEQKKGKNLEHQKHGGAIGLLTRGLRYCRTEKITYVDLVAWWVFSFRLGTINHTIL